MKKIALVFFVSMVSIAAQAQKNDFLVSFDGVGEIKLGMGKAELEKLLHIKIVLKHIGVDEIFDESVHTKYLGKDIVLMLTRSDNSKIAILEGFRVTDPVFKTTDGIGMGTDQATIVNKYEDQLLIIHPGYYEDPKLKNGIDITLANLDNYRAAIIFTMIGKKVVAIEVRPTPEFRDRE